MGALQWPTVVLKGKSQVIPRVCPNCLKEADADLRYCYIRPWDVFHRTRYWQSFRYCATCAPAALADVKHRSRTGWLLSVRGAMFVFFVGAVISLGVWQAVPFSPAVRESGLPFALGGALALVVTVLLVKWSKSSAVGRCPKQPQQAVWGVAAYYTGSPLLDILGNSKVYRAARPEWLAALVRANSDQVDDATYPIVGAVKPPREKKAPFAA